MSHRIFVTDYYTTAATMVQLVAYANTLVEKNEELKTLMHCYEPYGFDKGVYSRNRAMCLITKPKSNKDTTCLKKWDPLQPLEDFMITYIPPSTKAFDANAITQ